MARSLSGAALAAPAQRPETGAHPTDAAATTMNDDSLPWSRDDGRLGTLDPWRLALQAVAARLARRLRGRGAPLDDLRALRQLQPPETPLARELLRQATTLQPPWLLQHALRTYAWARLLAWKDRVGHDDEVLHAAALLHDLGLTPAAAEPAHACFAVRGARAAQELLRAAGAGPALARQVGSAIALHLDPWVPLRRHGAEAHLLQAGAACDVLGSRAGEIGPGLRAEVLRLHPRADCKRQLCACMRAQAERAPGTRMAYYVDRLDFTGMIERARWPH